MAHKKKRDCFLSCRVSGGEGRAIKAEARRQERTVSEVVRKAVILYLETCGERRAHEEA